jgi:hypothetical protein
MMLVIDTGDVAIALLLVCAALAGLCIGAINVFFPRPRR